MQRQRRGGNPPQGSLDRPGLTAILYEALAQPVGLVLRTSDTAKCQAQLYKVRRELGDPSLAELEIGTSPWEDSDLVIFNRGVLDASAT